MATRAFFSTSVRRLALFHYDPTRSDAAVDELQRCYAPLGAGGTKVVAAYEGLTIELY